MSFVIVGNVPIPVAPGGMHRERIDNADRSRAFDNTYRASQAGVAKRDFVFTTPPITREISDHYESILGQITPIGCSGDVIGGGSNLLPYSEDFTTWTDIGGVTLTGGQSDPMAGTGAYQFSDAAGSNARRSDVTFTGNGTKVASVFGKFINFAHSQLGIFDVTAGVFRHKIDINWNGGGTPTLSSVSGSGTLFPILDIGNGWYRISYSANSVVAANTNKVYIYPAFGGVGSSYFFGAQAENASSPTAYVKTTGTPLSTLIVQCCPEITGWTPVKTPSGHRVALGFVLHEV